MAMNNPTGRLTQGQFSFLPDLTDDEILLQVQYGLDKGYAWSIEYTDDPHPRNTYWEMYGMPMFDLRDAAGVVAELNDCRATFPDHYIRLVAFDSTRGVESIAMSFIVNRPPHEAGFALARQEVQGRCMRYTFLTAPTSEGEVARSAGEGTSPSSARSAGEGRG
jgi:ribulose-bisphosphate carboxylase small chain